MQAVEYAADIGVNHTWKEGEKHDICLGGDYSFCTEERRDSPALM